MAAKSLKLSFGLKAKPKAKPQLFHNSDDEEEQAEPAAKRQRVEVPQVNSGLSEAPSDPEVAKVAEKLAEFVAKNGRSFEGVTKDRNPGDTPFKFLFNTTSPDYRWYEQRVAFYEGNGASHVQPKEMAPTSQPVSATTHAPSTAAAPPRLLSVVKGGDSLAAMEAFTKLAAKHDEGKQQQEEDEQKVALLKETSFDRRRQLAVYKTDGRRGHHMQDFIPEEEMAKFLAKTGDEEAKQQAAAIEQRSRIQADNIGHKLLSKMGWKEGDALGASGGSGLVNPVSASAAKQDNLGLGAAAHGDVEEGDDEFEVYRKRMMLGYKHRPNPLGNPRKSYY